MRIFYGVQATGNGHITRARVLAPRLKAAGFDVTYLFSGRPWDRLFEMEVFGDYLWRKGLTFAAHAGRVSYLKTAVSNDIVGFLQDVRTLDLSQYDLIVTDFEPITAWAGRLQRREVIGIGHQYAFQYPIPKTGDDILARMALRYFAPAQIGIGLHWHHFDQPILPPIIETPPEPEAILHYKIVVYLPFEDIRETVRVLAPLRDHDFHIYSPAVTQDRPDHIHIKQLSRSGFQHDLRDCGGIICNAGFELASEALQMGKKLLVKPLRAQMEQLSNALALEETRLGAAIPELDTISIAYWLRHGRSVRVIYPNVASQLVDWLKQGERRIDHTWVRRIWDQVRFDSPPKLPARKQHTIAD